MIIDPAHPWGIPIDYAGRATVEESGHTVHVHISDTSLSTVIEPDPLTGQYPSVHVTAQITESGDHGAVLRGYARVTVDATEAGPVAPEPAAVQQAITEALADFQADTAGYAALCAAWSDAA